MTDPLRRAAARGFVPIGYPALAIAASRPLARDFAALPIGGVAEDGRHAIWIHLPRGGAFVAGAVYLMAILVCAPLLATIAKVVGDPAMDVVLGGLAACYSPDALSLVLPAPHQRWTSWLYPQGGHVADWVWTSSVTGLTPTPAWSCTGIASRRVMPAVSVASRRTPR